MKLRQSTARWGQWPCPQHLLTNLGQKKFICTASSVKQHSLTHRAVTVLDFSLPRWCSNKYRGLAVNRTTPPPSKKNWCGRICASAWSAAPKPLRAAEPQRIVAGVRFHWSHEEMYFQSSALWVELHSLHQHERDGACSRLCAKEDLVFKLK